MKLIRFDNGGLTFDRPAEDRSGVLLAVSLCSAISMFIFWFALRGAIGTWWRGLWAW